MVAGVPTISVGNIAMGGRGKTPLVAAATRALLAAGERPAILSRGYARRRVEDGVVVVSDGAHVLADLDRAGDEPLMLARALPGARVLVCDQRAMAARLAERALGATVLVLDDGFQHRAVARHVDIVSIATDDLEGRGLPFGSLRESPSSLARAHAIVVEGADARPAALAEFPATVFSMTRGLATPRSIEENGGAPPAGAKVVAVAGIANPERFTAALSRHGWVIARAMTFRDHYRFAANDLADMARAVHDTGAWGVLTTEKDGVRLRPLRPFAVPIAAVPLDIRLDGPQPFDDWLVDRVRKART